ARHLLELWHDSVVVPPLAQAILPYIEAASFEGPLLMKDFLHGSRHPSYGHHVVRLVRKEPAPNHQQDVTSDILPEYIRVTTSWCMPHTISYQQRTLESGILYVH
ncbi:hypothetical protein PIB30_080590, partial [Stylosanthes scabra]|nr:hypothetical protein [Stylosanthes scabra]